MVIKRQCSFCAQEIEPGTGMMFVKRDGTVFHFCTSSCRKQQLHLHRVGHRFKWTRAHELKRAADRSSAQKAPGAPGVKAGRTRPAPRRPAAPPPAIAPSTEPSPAPTAEPASKEGAPGPEPTTAPPAPVAKPRRPRKKAEAASKE